MQSTALWCLAHPTPELVGPIERSFAGGADIALVRPDGCFLTMQELIPDLAIVGLGRGGLEAVHDAAVRIDADMRLHTAIPVVAFLRR